MEIQQIKLDHEFVEKPWGWYKVLIETDKYKVKELLVKPGHLLSYQTHKRRAEHWFIAKGEAYAIIDDKKIELMAGESVDIPVETKHRIGNNSKDDMVFIEVQTGNYFGEDDIIRIEDNYGRENK